MSRRPRMPIYAVTYRNIDGSERRRFEVACADDDQVIELIGESAYPGPIEIRQGERLVASVPAWPATAA